MQPILSQEGIFLLPPQRRLLQGTALKRCVVLAQQPARAQGDLYKFKLPRRWSAAGHSDQRAHKLPTHRQAWGLGRTQFSRDAGLLAF